jgi:hypothetical protein
MRTTYITSSLLAFVLVVALGLTAQTSTTGSSPQATPPSQAPPSQTTPQQEPQAAPPQQPSQSAPSQAPSGQSGSASQSQTQRDDDNPLNLTEEQKTKLRPIIADENQQMEAVRNDTSMTTEQKVAKANQIREQASPKIKAILTQEQLQKLAELQQKARQQQSAPQTQQSAPQQQQSAPPSEGQKPPQ